MDAKKVPGSTVTESTTLSLDTIKQDSALQVRVKLNEATIAEYAKEMQDGAEFPPVDVFYDGATYLLANGFHRYSAARSIERKEISVRVHQGNQRDAILFAIGVDTNVGLRRSNDDKNKVVELLLNDDEWKTWSDGKLAKLAGVSDRFIAKVRKERSPNGSQMTTVKYTKNGKDQVMTLTKKVRAEKQDSEIKSAPEEKEPTLSKASPSFFNEDDETVEPEAVLKTSTSNDSAKTMYRRKISTLEASAIAFLDELDALLSKDLVPDRKATDAVGDVEVLVKRFLEKFSKDEV
jgi:hypothetical protein